jgi:hypothetical protein
MALKKINAKEIFEEGIKYWVFQKEAGIEKVKLDFKIEEDNFVIKAPSSIKQKIEVNSAFKEAGFLIKVKGYKIKNQTTWGPLIFIIIILIIGFSMCNKWCAGPSVSIKGDVGTITHDIPSYYCAELAGFFLAKEVYQCATRNPELKRIIVHCELDGNLTDKYGKPVKGPYEMGQIIVNNLDEIRKYNDDGSYAIQNKDLWRQRVNSLMHYSELLPKQCE